MTDASIAHNLRAIDKKEVIAMTGEHDVYKSLYKALSLEGEQYTAEVDGDIVAIFGVAPHSLNRSVGIPWFLGTDAINNLKREMLKDSSYFVTKWSTEFHLLFNYVHEDNKRSIRWLKWLGFDVKDKVTEFNGEFFRLFQMVRK